MMLQRPPVAEIITGLSTTSDKVRDLARAGYLRTEISKALDIRYQHVRKVLLDAGISEGLTRMVDVERPPVTVSLPPEPPPPTPGSFLLENGFRALGQWRTLEDGEFELSAVAPADAGVYAFILEGMVVYVGLTQTGLRTRMGHYRRGHQRQRTSARVKGLIAEALSAGKVVEVFIATPEAQEWNGLPVNTAAGLEAGLIRMMRPQWNMLGAKA